MKKLMIVAAGAILAANSYGIAVTNCHNEVKLDCPQIVFKLTATGKTVAQTEKDDSVYSSVNSLKVSKGALVLFGEKTIDSLTGEADCCYPTYSLYLPVKVGKENYKFAFLALELNKWSVFGKNLEKLEAAMADSKTKKVSLESDLGLFFTDEDSSTDVDSFDEITGVTLAAAAFGKATYGYYYKESKNACTGCTVSEGGALVPGNYSGWFAGYCDAEDDAFLCLNCVCSDIRIFGGTWKAKYNKAWSKQNGWKSAASYAFGGTTLAQMLEEEVE